MFDDNDYYEDDFYDDYGDCPYDYDWSGGSDGNSDGFWEFNPVVANAPKRNNLDYASDISSEEVQYFQDLTPVLELAHTQDCVINDKNGVTVCFFGGPYDGSVVPKEMINKNIVKITNLIQRDKPGIDHYYIISNLGAGKYVAYYNGNLNEYE